MASGFIRVSISESLGLFKRLHQNNAPGVGIGLASCKRIVDYYGGEITVESSPHRGSTFSFTVPNSFPIDTTEEQRLRALHSCNILDTPPDPELNALVESAAALFSAPIALISLVDKDRQWFKARVGLDLPETSRDLSFCAHAILESQPLIVNDASADQRFETNALVTGEPFIRFYAGAQLRTRDGFSFGNDVHPFSAR